MSEHKSRHNIVKVDFQGSKGAQDSAGHARREFVDYLFRRYRQSLTNYLRGLLHSPSAAEEVLQESYIRLIQAKSLDSLESRARAFLFKIATNLARDKYRYDASRAGNQHIPLEDVELTSNESPIEQVVEWRNGLEIVKHCLLELPSRTRKAFILYTWEQLTLREVAGMLGVSSKTVERDIATALQLCQHRLQE